MLGGGFFGHACYRRLICRRQKQILPVIKEMLFSSGHADRVLAIMRHKKAANDRGSKGEGEPSFAR